MSVKVNPTWFEHIPYLGGEQEKKFFRFSKTIEQSHKDYGLRLKELARRRKLPLEEQQYEKYKDIMKWLLKKIEYKTEWNCRKISENLRTLKNGKRLKEYKYFCDRYEKEYSFYSDLSANADRSPHIDGNKGDQGCIKCKMILGELWLSDLLDRLGHKYIYRKNLTVGSVTRQFSFYILVGKGMVVEHHSRKHYIANPELAQLVKEDKEKIELCKRLDIPYTIIPYGLEYGRSFGPSDHRTKFSLNKEIESQGDVTEKCLSVISTF